MCVQKFDDFLKSSDKSNFILIELNSFKDVVTAKEKKHSKSANVYFNPYFQVQFSSGRLSSDEQKAKNQPFNSILNENIKGIPWNDVEPFQFRHSLDGNWILDFEQTQRKTQQPDHFCPL